MGFKTIFLSIKMVVFQTSKSALFFGRISKLEDILLRRTTILLDKVTERLTDGRPVHCPHCTLYTLLLLDSCPELIRANSELAVNRCNRPLIWRSVYNFTRTVLLGALCSFSPKKSTKPEQGFIYSHWQLLSKQTAFQSAWSSIERCDTDPQKVQICTSGAPFAWSKFV